MKATAKIGAPKKGAPMVKVFVRNGILYLEFPLNGKRKQRSTGLRDTPKNRRLVQKSVVPKFTEKLVRGELDEQKKQPELFEKYAHKYLILKEHRKTAREIGQLVARVTKSFKGRDVTSVRRVEVQEWAHDLMRNVTPKTARNYVNILRGIFDVAVQYEVMDKNPADHVALPEHQKAEVEPFTPEEVDRIIAAADGWFRNFIAISFYTGMRTGEVCGLMLQDIDMDTMTISVKRSVSNGIVSTPKTKNGVREVPIFSAALPYLEAQMKNPSSLYLFQGKNGGHLHGAGSLRKKWIGVCEKAGVEYRKMYATRHTFITSMLKSGTVSILELAQMVGHGDSESIIKNYARFIKGEHLRISRNIDPFALQNC